MGLPASSSGACGCIELTTNGTDWTDFSDWISVVTPENMGRIAGSAHVLGEVAPIHHVGKQELKTLMIRGIYSEGTTTADPFAYVFGQWETACDPPLGARWSPFGCTTDNEVFATATATGRSGGRRILGGP